MAEGHKGYIDYEKAFEAFKESTEDGYFPIYYSKTSWLLKRNEWVLEFGFVCIPKFEEVLEYGEEFIPKLVNIQSQN